MLEDMRGYLVRRKECQRWHHNSCTIKPARAGCVSSNIKMCKSSKLELTHLRMVASSADFLRRCTGQIAKGGTSERDIRVERRWPFDPGDCQGAGRFPEHGAPVSEIAGGDEAEGAATKRVEAGPAPGVHRPANGGRTGELPGAGSGDPRPGLPGQLFDGGAIRAAAASVSSAGGDDAV